MLAIKNSNQKKSQTARIFYADLWGNRTQKSDRLFEEGIDIVDWNLIEPVLPYYFFKPKSDSTSSIYQSGFSIDEIFIEKSTGYYTSADEHVIAHSKAELMSQLEKFPKQNKIAVDTLIRRTTYRPLDNRYIYYDLILLSRSRNNFVKRISQENNLILISGKSTKGNEINHGAGLDKGTYLGWLYDKKTL